MSDGLKPGAIFYMPLPAWNADGTLDPNGEAHEWGEDLQTVIAGACERLTSYEDDTVYIYECRAVRKITRGKIKIQTISGSGKAGRG